MNKVQIDKKRLVIVGLAVLVFIILIVLIVRSQNNQSNEKTQPAVTPTTAIAMPSETMTEYKDEAGFSIQYPDDLKLEKKESTNESVYADVELRNESTAKGKTEIRIQSTTFKDPADVINNKTIQKTDLKEIKIADIEGLEYEFTEDKKIISWIIDQGILFNIETTWDDNKNRDYWINVHQQLMTSFTFVQPEESTVEQGSYTEATPAEDEIIFEGEEVVE